MPRGVKAIKGLTEEPKYKICVSGAAETGHCEKDAYKKAMEIGAEIARRDLVLITGATTGMPYWAAKGAKESGGMVIGFSPASSKVEHETKYKLPTDYHDIIVYTGFDYSGRDLFLTRASDATVTLCGRIGTLHEFTINFEGNKPIGVLEGTGGTTDMIRDILDRAKRGPGKVVFDTNPKKLLDTLIQMVEKEYKIK